MGSVDFVVVGAGPAGAAFTYKASRRGYKVAIYEQAPWPAFKACGWAVPRQIRQIIDIPREVVLTEIRGFRVFLDNKLVHEKIGADWGFIIDKRAFIEYMINDAELYVKNPIRIDGSRLRVIGETVRPTRGYVIATGSSTFPQKERIYAVQKIIRTEESIDEETVEFWFDRNLVGYYWVFPRGQHIVDIGVGGFGEPKKFVAMLEEFAKKRFTNGYKAVEQIRGAWINIGGVEEKLFYSIPPVIGEAAGFVYPLTGEGIRPSIVSALSALERFEGEPLPSYYGQTVRWISIQRQILDVVRKTSPETRARILSRLPVDIFVGIGVGELTPIQLVRALPVLPASIASVLRKALKRRRVES